MFLVFCFIFFLQDADKNKNASNGKENVLDREEFVAFYNSLTRRTEIEEIFLRYLHKIHQVVEDRTSCVRICCSISGIASMMFFPINAVKGMGMGYGGYFFKL